MLMAYGVPWGLFQLLKVRALEPLESVPVSLRGLDYCMRLDVLAAMKMTKLTLWVQTLCRFVGRYDRLGRTYCMSASMVQWHATGTKVRKFKPGRGAYLRTVKSIARLPLERT
jgi:hypothetical protein